jgi:hypothetical protein
MPHVLNIQTLAAAEDRQDYRDSLLDGHAERLLGRFQSLAARVERVGRMEPPAAHVQRGVGA